MTATVLPEATDAAAPPRPAPILEVEGLIKHFGGERRFLAPPKPKIRAIDGVSFRIHPGEVVGLVGESGSGKTTVGRTVLRLTNPTGGRILFEGEDITTLSRARMRPFRRRMQIVFQDPFASLNPRLRVADILGEAYAIHGHVPPSRRMDRTVELLETVGLSADHLARYPHEFSGGQRQRLVIARALAVEPTFLVADEPVSALDVSIQAQIIGLMSQLQRDFGLAMLFISHDLSVVEYVCDRVMVMYLGQVMEAGPVDRLFAAPRHPYTMALQAAAPIPDPEAPRRRMVLQGDIPSPANPPSGCVFRTRCPFAIADCAKVRPAPRVVGPEHTVACIRDDIG
ncbi:MAG: ABC transporter ATP-binding protein [Rhodospirillales bacterium]